MPDPPAVPESLLRRIRADPARAPELIALAAADRHGPAAKAWADGHAGTSPQRLARQAKRTHARLARVAGAATGLGGALTMVPDMATAIWLQSRVVFFVAAAYGKDPLDPMRPAELLVLFDLYPTREEARRALDGAGRTLAVAAVHRALGHGDQKTLFTRLAGMLVRRGAARLPGRAVPGVAVVANAVGNERALRALADDAIAYYAR